MIWLSSCWTKPNFQRYNTWNYIGNWISFISVASPNHIFYGKNYYYHSLTHWNLNWEYHLSSLLVNNLWKLQQLHEITISVRRTQHHRIDPNDISRQGDLIYVFYDRSKTYNWLIAGKHISTFDTFNTLV